MFRVALNLLLLLSVSSAALSQSESGAVRGTISSSSGAPIKDVVVAARTADSKFRVAVTTDESGAYTFSNLRAGTYTVLARMPGLQLIHSGLQISTGESVRLNFLSNPANSVTLSGSVADPTGAKIPGVLVAVLNEDTHAITSTRTEPDGSYSFPSLQVRVYVVSATLQGFRTLRETDVQLGSGPTILNFKLTLAALNCPPSYSCINLLRPFEDTISLDLLSNRPPQ